MGKLKKMSVYTLLREQLIDLALKTKNKEMFINLTKENWGKYIFGEEIIEDDRTYDESYLEKEFYLLVDLSRKTWEKYVDDTTITDVYEEKKKKLEELFWLSKQLNKNIHQLVKHILADNELIHLLIFTSDKTFRNGVFYMDEKSDKVLIKDNRHHVCSLSIKDALEFYKQQKSSFFIEVQPVLRNHKTYFP